MMMKQQTLAMAADQSGYEHYRKPTRRDEFLKTMEAIVPWAALCAVIEPHHPKAGNSTIVDATIIGAPSSTKNADKARPGEGLNISL